MNFTIRIYICGIENPCNQRLPISTSAEKIPSYEFMGSEVMGSDSHKCLCNCFHQLLIFIKIISKNKRIEYFCNLPTHTGSVWWVIIQAIPSHTEKALSTSRNIIGSTYSRSTHITFNKYFNNIILSKKNNPKTTSSLRSNRTRIIFVVSSIDYNSAPLSSAIKINHQTGLCFCLYTAVSRFRTKI